VTPDTLIARSRWDTSDAKKAPVVSTFHEENRLQFLQFSKSAHSKLYLQRKAKAVEQEAKSKIQQNKRSPRQQQEAKTTPMEVLGSNEGSMARYVERSVSEKSNQSNATKTTTIEIAGKR
jgi:hypothetical protein